MIEDCIKSAIKRRVIRSVLIKDDGAFNALYQDLQNALTKAYDQAARDAIIAGLDRLRDLGAGSFGLDDKAMILSVIESKIGADALTALTRKPMIDLTDSLYRLGFHEIGKGAGLDLGFMRPDLDALDILQSGNLYWVGNSWNAYTQDRIQAALNEYFTDGMTRDGLMERFTRDLADIADKAKPYWAIIADHTATKTREMGRVAGYDRAGFSHVQVRAHLDDSTTAICRAMNGRVIPVSRLKTQRDDYLAAMKVRNQTAAKDAWQMHAGNDASSITNKPTSRLPHGTGSPPYHFRCRTITVAYFMDEEGQIGEWKRKTYDRIPLDKKDIEQIIDRAKSASWPTAKTRGRHFKNHKDEFGFTNHAQYSQSAIDLIRSGDRDVFLSIRKGELDAVFARKGVSEKGEKGHFTTIIDVNANKIRSHHHKRKLNSSGDQVQNVKQSARGVMKWLIN